MPRHACPSCNEPYAAEGGREHTDAKLPVVLPCLCTCCKGCALAAEAEAQQAAAGTKQTQTQKQKQTQKRKLKQARQAAYAPTPCYNCKALSVTPVAELLVDVARMKEIRVSAAQQQRAPLCDACEGDQATRHCADCPHTPFVCESCCVFLHRSAQKEGHTVITVQQHFGASAGGGAGGGAGAGAGAKAGGGAGAAASSMCSVHLGYPLHIFCETCNTLICGMCGSLEHKQHKLTPMQDAIDRPVCLDTSVTPHPAYRDSFARENRWIASPTSSKGGRTKQSIRGLSVR